MERWDRHQVPPYVAAVALGVIVGLLFPSLANPLEVLINPILGLLLFATFLGVTFVEFGRAFKV